MTTDTAERDRLIAYLDFPDDCPWSFDDLVRKAAVMLRADAKLAAELADTHTWEQWREIRDQQAASITTLTASALEADAARYRWWRQNIACIEDDEAGLSGVAFSCQIPWEYIQGDRGVLMDIIAGGYMAGEAEAALRADTSTPRPGECPDALGMARDEDGR
jgi:hypothetical protein